MPRASAQRPFPSMMMATWRASPGFLGSLPVTRAPRLADPSGGSLGRYRDALLRVMRWKDGRFEFSFREIEGPDRMGVPTTALMLDLARLQDELGR